MAAQHQFQPIREPHSRRIDSTGQFLDAPPEIAPRREAGKDAVEVAEIAVDEDLVAADFASERVYADRGEPVAHDHRPERVEDALARRSGVSGCAGFHIASHHTVTCSALSSEGQ